MESSSSPTSSPSSSPTVDGRTSDAEQQNQKPLSAIAQQAYDRYGVLDPVKLDLMVRGIFITREDAAALPHSITPDGCPEAKTGGSHYQRDPISNPAPRLVPLTPTAAARAAPVARAPSVASSSARTDISAVPSDHGKWAEGETKLLIKMRAERIGFKYIADQFPGKNQKAVQDKFYKSIKDTREPRWKRLYDDLRAQHDGITAPCAEAVDDDPIEVSEGDTVVQPTENSSETLSETAMGEADKNIARNIQSTLGNNMKDIENCIEDVMNTV